MTDVENSDGSPEGDGVDDAAFFFGGVPDERPAAPMDSGDADIWGPAAAQTPMFLPPG